jgi:hypothetical protein
MGLTDSGGSQLKTDASLAALIGDPKAVYRELENFRKAAAVLSSQQPRMIEQYPKQWIAVYEGQVRAVADTLRELLALVDEKQLPREHIVVRFVDRDQRTMIL